MQPRDPESAFGFYQKEKTPKLKTTKGSNAKKIKTKYEELKNKKKNLKLKKASQNGDRKLKAKDVSIKAGIADWTVRKGQFDQLKPVTIKPDVKFEDSRVSGRNKFQHLLQPIDVDRFMR